MNTTIMPSINIPENIYLSLERRAKEKEYLNTQDYILSVLKKIVEELQNSNKSQEETYSQKEEKIIKDRLRGLGYID